MEMIKNSHLPDKKVKALICGNNSEITKLLSECGAEVITLSDDKRLPRAIMSHADIQCCYMGDGLIFTTNQHLRQACEAQLIDEIPSDSYPGDCLLNCFVLNGVLVTGKHCSKSVLRYAERNSIEIKFVNQGYAKCSTAIVSNDAIITADKTIAKALENHCNVLMIEQGNIRLDGYNYGFIGGVCGKLSLNELAFYGNPYKHPDGRSMISFIEANNCEVISLCNGELVDFGGFIPIKE